MFAYISTPPKKGGDIQLESLEILPPRRNEPAERYLLIVDHGISSSSCKTVQGRQECIDEAKRIVNHILYPFPNKENVEDEE